MQKGTHEVSLWRAVILQATLDCITQSKRGENIKARGEALVWFNIENLDFLSVCQYAELNPYFVLKRIKYALNNQEQWRRRCDVGKGKQFIQSSKLSCGK